MCCGADRRDQNTFTKAPAHSTDGIPVPPAPWLVYLHHGLFHLHHGLFHLHHGLFHLHHGLSTCTMACSTCTMACSTCTMACSTCTMACLPAPWLVYLHHGLFHLHHGLSTCTMACLPEHLWAHCCYSMAIGNLKCFFCTCLVSWSLFMVFLMQRDLQPSLKVFCSLFTANFSQKVQYMHLLVSLN